MPTVYITEPKNGTKLNYDENDEKKITIRWESDPKDDIKSWKFYLGTEDGRWDLLMCEMDALKHIDLDHEEWPLGGRLFAQVRGVYKGKGKNRKGEDVDMVERVLSDTVQWICPAPGLMNSEAH